MFCRVLAHGALGHAEPARDLRVGVPGGEQVQQFPVPRRELRDRVAAPVGVEIGLVQVRAQQGEQRAVCLSEVSA
jgi:hypothetical protein